MKILFLIAVITSTLSCAHRPLAKNDLICVVGIKSTVGDSLSAEESLKISKNLEQELKLKGLNNICGPDDLKNFLHDDVENLRLSFGNDKIFNPLIYKIHEKYPDLRALIIGKIEGDDLIYDRVYEKIEGQHFRITTSIDREIKIWLEVVDMKRWSTNLGIGFENTAGQKKDYEDDLDLNAIEKYFKNAEVIMGKLFRTYKPNPQDEVNIKYPFPVAPSLEDVLRPTFSNFAQTLFLELAGS